MTVALASHSPVIILPLIFSIVMFPAFGNERKWDSPKTSNKPRQEFKFVEMNAGSNEHFQRPKNRNYKLWGLVAFIAAGIGLGAGVGLPGYRDIGLFSENPDMEAVYSGALWGGLLFAVGGGAFSAMCQHTFKRTKR